MRTVRECCFETNSSSTHTLVMCNDSELKRFKEGKLFAHRYDPIGTRLDHAKLVNLDCVYRIYNDMRDNDESYSLPALTKKELLELLNDPLTHDDYSYKDNQFDSRNCYVVYDVSKHSYSDSLKKKIEGIHTNDLYFALCSDEFPKSYTALLRLTDKKDRSEKKLNVLDFEIWD